MSEYNEIRTLSARLEALERRMRASETAPRASATGIGFGGLKVNDGGNITVNDGGDILINDGGELFVDGVAKFNSNTTIGGTLVVSGATTINGTLAVGATSTFGGNSTFNGSVVINGNLSVPNGSIDNAALASPLVIVGAPPVTTGGWAVSSAFGAMASSSIAVPAGFSRATVVAWANMHFMDSSPNGGWVRATIAGNGGAEMGGLANLNLGQSASHTLALTGLAGGAIAVSCDVRASVGTGGMSGRIAQITAVGFFQR